MLRVDDTLPEDPRLASLSPALWAKALSLWLAASCYASRNLTDGVVPKATLPRLVPFRVTREFISALTSEPLRLLFDRGDAYVLDDFLLHNWSRLDVVLYREQNAKRQRSWRHRQRETKAGNGLRNGVTDSVSNAERNRIIKPSQVKDPPISPPKGGKSSVRQTLADKARADARVQEVFRHYLERLVRGGRYVLSDKRATAVLKALELKTDKGEPVYTVTDLKLAIDGCATSDWHIQNHRQDLELVCRNPEHIDQFKALAVPAEKPEARPYAHLSNEEFRKLYAQKEEKPNGKTHRSANPNSGESPIADLFTGSGLCGLPSGGGNPSVS